MDSNYNENTQPSITQPPTLKRSFIIGDEWLYYKFYSGPKTADVLLADMVKPVTEHLLGQKMIDSWFFIRYSDPKLHIRVRFHVTDSKFLGPIIQLVRSQATPYVEQNLVWKIQMDTYLREVERYGVNSMELAEQWFCHDSNMIVGMLAMIEGDEGERIRWLFALRSIDCFLQDFGHDMQRKFELVTMLRESFGREHGMNRSLKEQMEKKFRRDRAVINELMDPANDELSEMLPLFQLLEQKTNAVKPIAEQILALDKEKRLNMRLNDLMASYSHMMINRMFKSKQRTHEMVLYDFLHRYYKSELARRKYSQINAEKKSNKKKDKDKKQANEQASKN